MIQVSAQEISVDPQKSIKDMYFRLVTHGGDDPFRAVVQKGMQDACKELGCKADIDWVAGILLFNKKGSRKQLLCNLMG